ncbi:hypothetical protein Leryth_009509 [Lithospermum erythrorhizon]|nr:hypothetical protein Leryth_009509 [Lithospermum erythrorhizon]
MPRKAMPMKPWVEVAPSLLVFPQKASHCPKLETIKEDQTAEGYDG